MNECLPSLVSLVAQYRALHRDLGENCELEARLGTLTKPTGNDRAAPLSHANKFSATLHPLTFNDVCSSLDLCTEWSSTAEWVESVDVFFRHNAHTFRTSICGDNIKHIEKVRMTSQFLRCQSVRAAISSECGLDLRFSISSETPIPTEHLPAFTNTTLVRIKQRKSYTFRHWRFDVSRVWQGETRLSADNAQKNSAPNYEVELELVDAAPYLEAHSDEYIAKSMCMKLWDLLHRVSHDPSLTYTPV